MAAFLWCRQSDPANSNAVELQGHFGGMSLMWAMRRASEFRELLTEFALFCTEKKTAIFFLFMTKIKRKTFKSIILKIKPLIKTQIREKKIRHSGTEPGSPGHKSTTLTTELREPSLQNFGVPNLKNAWIDFKTNFIFYSFESVSIEWKNKKIQIQKIEKLRFFISFRWRPEVTTDVRIYERHCG